jgi:hypothetical protein
MSKRTERQFSLAVQMANKYMKQCSMPLAIKETQIKTALRFYVTPVKTALDDSHHQENKQQMLARMQREKGTLKSCLN